MIYLIDLAMKKYAYMIAAAVAVLACTKENNPATEPNPVEPQPLVEMTFGASLEVPVVSRAVISGNKTLWTSNDKISVFEGAENREFYSIGEGAEVKFRGEAAAAGTYYALYPYQLGASCTEGEIKATVPSEQTATPGSFDPAAALMVARGSESFEFKNVCSLIKVTVPDGVTGITSIEFSGNKDEKIAGNVTVSFDENGLPVTTGADVKTITLKAAERETLAAGDYYIAALPNTYSQGLKLLIHYDNGMFQQAKATGELKVERSAVRPVGSVKWPEVVFLGADDVVLANNLEVNTAVQWMIYNIPNSAYVPFEVLNQENTKVLDNCKVVWWHYHNDNKIDSKEELIKNVNKCDWTNVKNLLVKKLNSGTGFLLTRFATHYQAVLGVAQDSKGPNNCWGDPEPGTSKTDGIREIYTAGSYTLKTHPLFKGLTNNEENNEVTICMVDGGYLLSNSVARYNVHEGWGDYVVKNSDLVNFDESYKNISEKVGCNLLAKDGDKDIVIWEFPSTETRKGKVLCIGTPLYDWHTTEGTWEWTANSYHNNVLDMTRNAIDYLKPASENASAE